MSASSSSSRGGAHRTIDLDSYLDSVEDAVRSGNFGGNNRSLTPPGGGGDDGGGGGKIIVAAKEEHRRVMIRTLLSMPSRVEYDEKLREARAESEFVRWTNFVHNALEPALSSDGGRGEAVLKERNPAFRDELNGALGYDYRRGKVNRRFSRMASCRTYRGDLGALLRDAAPDAVGAYEEMISKGPTEEEVARIVIERRAGVEESRRDMALRCLVMDLSSGGLRQQGNVHAQAAGQKCERECVDFLRAEAKEKTEEADMDSGGGRSRMLVLENVYVKQTRRGGKSFDALKAEWERSSDDGVIVSAADRHCITSEFDAAVVDTLERRVAEIWESKHTVGPGTVADALSKKLSSLRSLRNEEGSMLLYRGGSASLSSSSPEGEGEGRRRRNDRPPFLFGIFGRTLQSPSHGAAQLRTVACQELLRRDVEAVMRTLETGAVELDVDDVIDVAERVRRALREAREGEEDGAGGFSVRVVVADGASPWRGSSSS